MQVHIYDSALGTFVYSNDSQAHLNFCFAKGACEYLKHILMHQNSKCFGAVCTNVLRMNS